MTPYIARIILWFIVTVILLDAIKEFNKLFEAALNPHLAIVLAVPNYVLHEFVIINARVDQGAPANTAAKIFYLIGFIIVGSLVLCVLIVWALVIYKASIKGGL